MTKRGKVVKGLECCIMRNPDDKLRCLDCPYKDPESYCLNRLKHDALEVLKGEEDGCNGDYCEFD